MGCSHCQDIWFKKHGTEFIINYEDSEYVVPDIDLFQKIEKNKTRETIEKISQTAPPLFRIKERIKGHPPIKLSPKNFRNMGYSIIGYLLNTGELENYKQD